MVIVNPLLWLIVASLIDKLLYAGSFLCYKIKDNRVCRVWLANRTLECPVHAAPWLSGEFM